MASNTFPVFFFFFILHEDYLRLGLIDRGEEGGKKKRKKKYSVEGRAV